ncbi:hypothetical protein H8356DRAFT_1686130 [Neocallimastix lanati (nom. inval.)]|nr:hypothetical protein H8356DRAFT_1686130 [Neocallimastix sp. JGI-2020a]
MTSSQKTISLLNEDGTLTEKLCFLLKEIFISFDYDKDNMLSREELRHYFSTLNGERIEDSSLDMAMMITSGNTVGFMLKDFYAFYEFQTKFNTIETISDLSKLFSQETLIERLT